MALQIEACPFCGGEHLHMVVHSLTYSVACQSCRCRGPQKNNQEQAVMQWNATSRKHLAASDRLLDSDRQKASDKAAELANRRLTELLENRNKAAS